MDGQRFDALIRRLAASRHSRRTGVLGLLAGFLGAPAVAEKPHGRTKPRGSTKAHAHGKPQAAACFGANHPCKKPAQCCSGVCKKKGKKKRCKGGGPGGCKPDGSECDVFAPAECCAGGCLEDNRCGPCRQNGEPCDGRFDCCSDYCPDDVCAKMPCFGSFSPCERDGECCSGQCEKEPGEASGRCSSACLPAGRSCDEDGECCSEICSNGSCLGGCAPDLEACNGDDECCSGQCRNGTCKRSDCKTTGAACEDDLECCSETCTNGTCEYTGLCIEPGTCGDRPQCGAEDWNCSCGTTIEGDPFCTSGTRCHTATRCEHSTDCPSGWACSRGCCRYRICVPPCAEPCRGNGAGCSTNDQCCAESCDGGTCAAATCRAEGTACRRDEQCCSAWCKAGQCDVHPCGRETGDSCSVDDDCCEGSCVAGACDNACTADGQECTTNRNCCSGDCTNGSCAPEPTPPIVCPTCGTCLSCSLDPVACESCATSCLEASLCTAALNRPDFHRLHRVLLNRGYELADDSAAFTLNGPEEVVISRTRTLAIGYANDALGRVAELTYSVRDDGLIVVTALMIGPDDRPEAFIAIDESGRVIRQVVAPSDSARGQRTARRSRRRSDVTAEDFTPGGRNCKSCAKGCKLHNQIGYTVAGAVVAGAAVALLVATGPIGAALTVSAALGFVAGGVGVGASAGFFLGNGFSDQDCGVDCKCVYCGCNGGCYDNIGECQEQSTCKGNLNCFGRYVCGPAITGECSG